MIAAGIDIGLHDVTIGLLSGEEFDEAGVTFLITDLATFDDLARVGHHITIVLLQHHFGGVLRWIVQRDLITIPRAKPNLFAENLEILQFSLAEEDMAMLNGLNINLRSNKDNDPETFPW